LDLTGNCPTPAWINSVGMWSIPGDMWLFSFSIANSTSKALVVLLFRLLWHINPMYIRWLREMVPPPSQNKVAVCTQITLLILYYIISRLVTLLTVNDDLIQVPNVIKIIPLVSSFCFSFHTFYPVFLKCLLALYLTMFNLSTLLWFGSCNHCILACCLWFKQKPKHSLNHSLCCFNSYRPIL
jgi:hypothetical protein